MEKIIGQAICPHCHCIGTTSLSFMNNHFDNCPEKIDQSDSGGQVEAVVKLANDGLCIFCEDGNDTSDYIHICQKCFSVLEKSEARQTSLVCEMKKIIKDNNHLSI